MVTVAPTLRRRQRERSAFHSVLFKSKVFLPTIIAKSTALLPRYPHLVPKVLKISDYDGRGVLAFDLKHLLPLIATVGTDLSWYVIPAAEMTWLLGDLKSLTPIKELTDKVEDSEIGVQLTWQELCALADSINQCIWATFVGMLLETPWPGVADMFADDGRYIDRAAPRFYETTEIAFQAVDSSYWLVYIRDDQVRERSRAAFDDVEVIDVGE